MVIRMKQVQVLDRKRVFDGFLKVDEATVSYEKLDGSMSKPVKRQSQERGDSVAVLLLDRSTQELILVRQFRYPMLRHGEPWLLEMVAGMIDESETPEIAARREVFEEVRAEPLDLQPIGSFYGSPGGLSEKIYLFYAEVERLPDGIDGGLEEEDIEIVRIAADACREIQQGGLIHDGKTQVALYWFAARR